MMPMVKAMYNKFRKIFFFVLLRHTELLTKPKIQQPVKRILTYLISGYKHVTVNQNKNLLLKSVIWMGLLQFPLLESRYAGIACAQ